MGRVGSNQYFCSECFLEFCFKKDNIIVYEIDNDGDLQFIGEIDGSHKDLIVLEKSRMFLAL